MHMLIADTPDLLGESLATKAEEKINAAIAETGGCRLLLSTGASQFETLKALRSKAIDWAKVEMFHLDEYLGMPASHPASFVRYLKERFADGLPLKAAHYLDGTKDPAALIAAITAEIRKAPIDVALIGIGENAHIAFNDPPADFDTDAAYIIVTLDERCRRQQLGEGWFGSLEEVPKQAVSMTVRQIMKSRCILSAVPGERKAEAIRDTLANDVTNQIPATILKTHPDFSLYLDKGSASLLEKA